MKRFFALSVLALLAYQPCLAEKKIQWSVAPSFTYGSGKTEYIMDINQVYIDTLGITRTYSLKSQLEFPLDMVTVGMSFRVKPVLDPDRWSIEAGIHTNLTDPGGIMKDSDWHGHTGYIEYTKFSYTESEAEMTSLILNLEGSYRFLKRGSVTVSVVGGGRYQKIKQDIIGYQGWWRPFDSVASVYLDPISVSGIEDAIEYEITFKQLQVGFLTNVDLSPNVAARLKTVYTPILFDDLDDHLLRNKIATSDGNGNGFLASLKIDYQLPKKRPGMPNPFMGATVDFLTLRATGDQTQEWYGDDGATPDDDTGNTIGGLPHEINSTQFSFGFRFGLLF